jgi:hypothetical protein
MLYLIVPYVILKVIIGYYTISYFKPLYPMIFLCIFYYLKLLYPKLFLVTFSYFTLDYTISYYILNYLNYTL